MKGRAIYFTADQIDLMISMFDPCNSFEDDERDEIRQQIFEKVTKEDSHD